MSLREGLVLVTGPTGSGKSTTLAALINEINKTKDLHIITIEDPIEYVHTPIRCVINQREIGTDSESYGAALRAVLREDPDVILMGEIRDLESMSIALSAAETGHLVFSTLHTEGAAKTIDPVNRYVSRGTPAAGARTAFHNTQGGHFPEAAAACGQTRANRRV